MRLNAYLARAGVASRRAADKLIKAGRVTVNKRPGQLNDDVSDSDRVEVDGRPASAQDLKYIMLNKPGGYVTTLDDPQGRPKVIDLIHVSERIVPVGRLDRDTTGLLLMTNDGELAQKLMHPSFKVDKVYEAEVEGSVNTDKLNMLSNGVEIEPGIVSAPARAKTISEHKLQLTIHEGRKHQVKKMLVAVGLPVRQLHRSQYGPLKLDSLKPGQWRELTSAEVMRLKAK